MYASVLTATPPPPPKFRSPQHKTPGAIAPGRYPNARESVHHTGAIRLWVGPQIADTVEDSFSCSRQLPQGRPSVWTRKSPSKLSFRGRTGDRAMTSMPWDDLACVCWLAGWPWVAQRNHQVGHHVCRSIIHTHSWAQIMGIMETRSDLIIQSATLFAASARTSSHLQDEKSRSSPQNASAFQPSERFPAPLSPLMRLRPQSTIGRHALASVFQG